ncbi:AMP-binding protein [Rhodococcus sp. NPDC057014]|uniref:AMP-binding protein n=1 Tax=Rhodococcus sp. NPDC057014 TaxID=3346000 RepID=UPI003631808D
MRDGVVKVGEPTTVVECLRSSTLLFPDEPFLDFGGETYTYRDVDKLSTDLARGLQAQGVGSGDTVAAVLANNVYAVALWLGANKIGAIYVPINTALKGDLLAHVVEDSTARVVVSDARFSANVAEVVLGAGREVVHFVHDDPDAPTYGARPIEDLLTEAGPEPVVPAGPGDLSCIIYTSGTTGVSKGCMVSHDYVLHVARRSSEAIDQTRNDVMFTSLPLFHLNALAINVLATMRLGAKVAIAEKFSLSGFWKEIQRSGATTTSLLGAMIPLVANAPDSPESLACHGQLRSVAGAPWTGDDIAKFKQRFGVQQAGSNRYGLTEAWGVTARQKGDPDHPVGSSGRRQGDFDVRIFNDEGLEVPAGVVGEIVIRPGKPHIMFEGYWRRPVETLDVFRGLWFHTGDLGYFDDDGYLWFSDRKKDYIRRRGENISSYEVEAVFRKHPDALDVAVVGVPSPLSEEDVKLCVVPNPGADVSPAAAEALCAWSFDRLPFFAVPRYIEFVDELPRTATGKIQKYRLRERHSTHAVWDREAVGIAVPR